MRSALVIALGGTVSLAASHSQHQRREVASFPAGQSWDILLNKGDINLDDLSSTESVGVSAIDIDLFDNEASTISALRDQNKQVICYFSAGSREDWRDDANKFTASDYGQGLDGWEGENWVNVTSDNVRSIMTSRIQLAASKGCTAVDPDNVDGFGDNQDGFGYEQSAYAEYVKFLAHEAAANGLAIGLKNALDLIPDVIDVIQFAVNEQCHEYNECDKYKPFTEANKAVFNIEYGGNNCASPAGVNLSILIKPENQGLNTLGGACDATGEDSLQSASMPALAQSAIAKSTSVLAPAQTPSLPVAPSVTSTSGALKPSSAAVEPEATAEPTSQTGDEDEEEDEDDEENEDDEDEEVGSEDEDEEEGSEDEDEEEEGNEDEDEEDEDAQPWYYRHD